MELAFDRLEVLKKKAMDRAKGAESRQNSSHLLRVASQVIEGPVAQRLEQGTHNPLVGGSNPSGPTILFAAEH
jgi:hypothetical protein